MGASNAEAFAAIKNAALHDPFWAVRLHALTMLHNFPDPAHNMDDALLDLAQHDPRPDVRAQAVEYLGHVAKEKADPVLSTIIDKDSSYNVVGKALAALHQHDPDKAYQLALNYLKTSSPRDRMRQSAISVIEQNKNHQSLDELVMLINQHDVPKWTRWGIIGSIANMADIDSALVYRTLWNLSNNGDKPIRGTALNKLADIGDLATLRQIEAQAATRPDMKVTYDALLKRMRVRLGVPEPPESHEPEKK